MSFHTHLVRLHLKSSHSKATLPMKLICNSSIRPSRGIAVLNQIISSKTIAPIALISFFFRNSL
jgi:hypothetical protein